MPEVVTMDSKYETLQRKKPSDEVISSEYTNLN